jgi:tetratricopeptide (TPR) repeat protein
MGEDIPLEMRERKALLLQEVQTMRSSATCAYCVHRRPRKICDSQSSHHFGAQVDLTDSCNFFHENPAQLAYIRAIFLDKSADETGLETSEIVKAFNVAIKAGLPADDELYARFRIAKRLVFWISDQHLDVMQRSKLRETEEAIQEFESALALDKEGNFGFFEEARGRLLLSQLDLMYVVEGGIRSIENAQGGNTSDAAAVEYWESKLPKCHYLSTNPLISTLVQAGYSYSRMGNTNEAIKCFRLAADASPVNIADGYRESEEAQQREARSCLEQLAETPKANPTKSEPAGKACFIATAVYGEDAPEVQALRFFRDNYLARNSLSRRLVRAYYSISPPIADVIRRHKALRAISRSSLNIVMRAIRKTLRAEAIGANTAGGPAD